ncbi:MAG: Asp-tRNA(Asn)/Glu-tRNA(Gln) amidotransferase subunit GatB [Chitinophagaceae bacterium]|nr:Asp-tRNA(Asn)/Glu-tRNA(Gln) amidotransferase subunit GatB [Chitinophagaceae bacterium]
MGKYEAVIGLEVHAQLNTVSKLFSGDATNFNALPNQHVGPITLGHPGTLPTMNKKAVELAIKMGLVCGCEISTNNYFARKNYFYADLPKGFQISQHTTPICRGGLVHINTTNGSRDIQLTRIHLEEDAGKSIHDQDDALTLLDFNRAGMPLIEIVSEPDMHSSEEAAAYLTQIRKLVRWIGVCDGNMEEGSLRCDANISVRPVGSRTLGTRVEVKNLNSIKHLRHAVEIEIERLTALSEKGETILQETRSYDADTGITFSIRTKEDAEDYRYFPEPDLAPFQFTEQYIGELKNQIPLLPAELSNKFINEYGLSSYDAEQLTDEKELCDLFEEVARHTIHKKQLANILLGPLKSLLNQSFTQWNSIHISATHWNELLILIAEGTINFSMAAQKILPMMVADFALSPTVLIQQLDLAQDADADQLQGWAKQALDAMPDKVMAYKKGKKGLIGLFVGEVKKYSKGKADPKQVTAILESLLHQ